MNHLETFRYFFKYNSDIQWFIFRNVLVDRAKVESEMFSEIDPDAVWDCCMDKVSIDD